MIKDGSSTGECDVAHTERGTILFCPCVLAGVQEEKICNDDHVAYTLCFFVVGGKGHRRHFPEHNDGAGLYWTSGWGDVPSTVVSGKDVKDGDRFFVTDK